MRPIDADALKQRFLEAFGRCSMWPINVIHSIIDGMPTMEVQLAVEEDMEKLPHNPWDCTDISQKGWY